MHVVDEVDPREQRDEFVVRASFAIDVEERPPRLSFGGVAFQQRFVRLCGQVEVGELVQPGG